jgi:tyrosine aminotransferase
MPTSSLYNIHPPPSPPNADSSSSSMSSSASASSPFGHEPVRASLAAQRTRNPIRAIVDNIAAAGSGGAGAGAALSRIPLSLGDPTLFGNLDAPRVLVAAVQEALASARHNGYQHSAGSAPARHAVAARAAAALEAQPALERRAGLARPALGEEDVVIACGCSGALDLAISALLNPGDVLLLPQPGFPLYETLCSSKGVEVRHYRLDPARGWQVDLDDLRAKAPGATALLVNNPSNPCGSVFSREHLAAVLEVAERHALPVIADEIYENLVFAPAAFVPMASLCPAVPVLAAGGIAKEMLVPGWRVGWVVVHDTPGGHMREVRRGLFALSQLVLGANSLMLAALPAVIAPARGSADEAELAEFSRATVAQLAGNAAFSAERLGAVPGLSVVVPQGAMYLMVGLDAARFGVRDDVEFSQLLLARTNVFVLPGECFRCAGFVRIVFCAPRALLAEAYDRIEGFCRERAAEVAAASAALAAGAAATA